VSKVIDPAVRTTLPAAEELPLPVLRERMVGPGDPEGLRRCIRCLEPFKEGESWWRVTSLLEDLAIGVHERCEG